MYKERYEEWCNNLYFDIKTREELKSINDEKEIEDRFYKDLEFGTAGLRGIMGAGTNRMNIYTVRKATQGLANYIIKKQGKNKGVAIAFDSRNMSKEFSEEVALCLNANGIKTYIFESLRPVPELSFAVRELKCIAGIVITASHNPPKYNGYKVYWSDGAQIIAPIDIEIMKEVKLVSDYNNVKTINKKESEKLGLYNIIGKELDDRYMEELKKLIINMDTIKKVQNEVKIVYSPLHGTGNIPVTRILKELGFDNVFVVQEQELPDGNFPTVKYPNPEDKAAFDLALKLAKEKDADIVLATDPDADRLGVYAKDKKTGEYMMFTGNMSALLIAEYILSQKKEQNEIPKNAVLIKTIVSSNLADRIAKEYNIKLIEVLTGFKYIGEKIKLFEENNLYKYIFGFEESYGCLVGTHARDKDAVAAVMMLCEASAYYKSKGLTLWDQMLKIYNKYGYYKEDIITITYEGIDGSKKMSEILNNLRNNPLRNIGKYKVISIRDYNVGKINNLELNTIEETDLPKSNVIYYELEDDAWCCVRPSGTEPKIKIYIGVKESSLENAEKEIKELAKDIKKKI